MVAATALGTWRATPVHAAGSLFSYDFRAAARGYQTIEDDPSTGDRNAEGEVPEANATLSTGPVGAGLATVAWPGPLAANAGTLLLVVNPSTPPQATMLNDPVRAEAHTGQNPPTATYDTVPGTHLTATAKADRVDALATVQNATGDPGTFGPSNVHSTAVNQGGNGKATASSLVEDISLAGGAVRIGSVASAAEATTDGVKGAGTASTTVTGLTIAGQSASIDEQGLHIGSTGQPANAIANQIVDQTLSQAGIKIVLSAPTRDVDGATATMTAGSLVVSWKTSGSIVTVVLGGARASATASPGGDDSVLGGADTPVGGTPLAAAPVSARAPSGATSASPVALAPDTGGEPSSSTRRPRPRIGLPAVAASTSRPVRPAVVLLALVAAGLLAAGLREIGAATLGDGAGPDCALGEMV
jgi:hypothetical protein